MSEPKDISIQHENNALIIFKPEHGSIEYQVLLDENNDTLWASEMQIANLFGRDRSVILKHIKNVYKQGELDEVATSAKIAQVRKEGRRKIKEIKMSVRAVVENSSVS